MAPKPYWAYRGQKQSEKAQGSSMVGQVDQWGGRYVEGGYTIDGQFFPLPGVDWVGWFFPLCAHFNVKNAHLILRHPHVETS